MGDEKSAALLIESAPKSRRAYDHVFKLLMIGDSNAGKTRLLFQMADESFNTTFISTIGIDFKPCFLHQKTKHVINIINYDS